ncbi:RNA-binding protein BRN1 [Zea mays]|uniref:RNA-binding protein BRN1 n=1 Tax=Zea mays TaxID=4577 RepID=A0A1D6FMK1_MAIZE|nr:RNA-binding protein BRN1 [Zea mays]
MPPSLLLNSFALPAMRCGATPRVGVGPTGCRDLRRGFAWDSWRETEACCLRPSVSREGFLAFEGSTLWVLS